MKIDAHMRNGQTRMEILAAVRDGEGDTRVALAEYLGLHPNTLHGHLWRLHGERLLHRRGKGVHGYPYRYRLSLLGRRALEAWEGRA